MSAARDDAGVGQSRAASREAELGGLAGKWGGESPRSSLLPPTAAGYAIVAYRLIPLTVRILANLDVPFSRTGSI